tara:strand:+ start:223 stop:990 length:768 start_codon:yes stop_codon:yes gene_type:complete
MEDLDEQTIAELKAKAIERGDEDDITTNEIDEELKEPDNIPSDLVKPEATLGKEEEPVKDVKKPKKQRSEKQKAAFEKARQKRAENLKIKKQLEAEKKEAKKAEKEKVKKEVQERLAIDSVKNPISQPVIKKHEVEETPQPRGLRSVVPQEEPRYREQVVNNYYYYGTPPPELSSMTAQQKPKRGRTAAERRAKKVVIQEPEPEPYYSSESEEEEIIYSDPEEPESYKELQNYQEENNRQLPEPKQNNGLKFRFA